MKYTLLSFLILSTLISCSKDDDDPTPAPSTDQLSAFIADQYYEDARDLYFHEVQENSAHANFNNPVLDDREIRDILLIIQAVYDLQSPARDSVFDRHQIHSTYCYGYQSISLMVDPQAPEIQKLVAGSFPTGESMLDRLRTNYGFDSVVTSVLYPDSPRLTVYSSNNFNLIPIAEQLKRSTHIYQATFNQGCVGDGDHITLDRNGHTAVITFSIGRGDCPAGCIYHKYWEFAVSNGVASFVRSY